MGVSYTRDILEGHDFRDEFRGRAPVKSALRFSEEKFNRAGKRLRVSHFSKRSEIHYPIPQ